MKHFWQMFHAYVLDKCLISKAHKNFTAFASVDPVTSMKLKEKWRSQSSKASDCTQWSPAYFPL